jgi:hypothetical protein
MRRRIAALWIAAALAPASCGADLRLSAGSNVSFHTGISSAAEGAISIEADGWTYAVPLDGVTWIDAAGTWHHDGGRPDCLAADAPAHQVRFAAVEVTVEGATWRPVVWVDCR